MPTAELYFQYYTLLRKKRKGPFSLTPFAKCIEVPISWNRDIVNYHVPPLIVREPYTVVDLTISVKS
jgi:hypothetical protein